MNKINNTFKEFSSISLLIEQDTLLCDCALSLCISQDLDLIQMQLVKV